MDKYEGLRLKNQLCFPLYSVSNLITRNYQPLLEKLDLTYTQYIVMMVLWEKEEVTEKQLGAALYLKSNTLTLLLQKLKGKGYVSIEKGKEDSRYRIIRLSEKGRNLKELAIDVPPSIAKSIGLEPEEAVFLHDILYKILEENQHEEL